MIWVGTSGYQYPEWRGAFYPTDLHEQHMLPYYAARFSTVEINYTAYRMPTQPAVLGWAAATPPQFKLTLRAPRRITHLLRLKNAAAPTAQFLRLADVLGDKRGAVLFQVPPEHPLDIPALDQFLAGLPPTAGAAFEFRNPDWLIGPVFDVLRAHAVALCVSDSETLRSPVERTADFGYFRLRDEGYSQADLERWAGVVREWDALLPGDVYVYFKHESQGRGPDFGQRLLQLVR